MSMFSRFDFSSVLLTFPLSCRHFLEHLLNADTKTKLIYKEGLYLYQSINATIFGRKNKSNFHAMFLVRV